MHEGKSAGQPPDRHQIRRDFPWRTMKCLRTRDEIVGEAAVYRLRRDIGLLLP